MRALFLLNIVMIFAAFTTSAQQGITYFDKDWKETTPDMAVFYRPAPEKVDSGYIIRDYYSSTDNLQYVGFSRTEDADEVEGAFAHYHENGVLSIKGHQKNKSLYGSYLMFDENGEILSSCVFSENKPVDGTLLIKTANYKNLLTFKDGGVIAEVHTDLNNRSNARIEMLYFDTDSFKVDYFDYDGTLIASTNRKKRRNLQDGITVHYGYHPMSVSEIEERSNGVIVNPWRFYYSSGKIKQELFFDLNNLLEMSIVYAEDGSILGVLHLENGTAKDGIEIEFLHNDSIKVKDIIAHSYELKNYMRHGTSMTNYPKKRWIKKEMYFQDERVDTTKIFDYNGNLIYSMVYLDGNMWHGTTFCFVKLLNDDGLLTYNNGELVEAIAYFDNSAPRIIVNINGDIQKRKYFDQKRRYLGEGTVVNDSLIDGIEARYKYAGGYYVTSVKNYKNGSIFKESFFNAEGELVKEFMPNGVSLFKNLVSGETVTCTYENNKPVSGTVYEYDEDKKKMLNETTYLDGKLNGIYRDFERDSVYYTYKDGVLHGLSEYYFNDVFAKQMYSEGRLHGKSEYHIDGEVFSALYEDGDIIDGLVVVGYYQTRGLVRRNFKNRVEHGLSTYTLDGVVIQRGIFNNGTLIDAETLYPQENNRPLKLVLNNDSTYSGEIYEENHYSKMQNNSLVLFKKYYSNNALQRQIRKVGKKHVFEIFDPTGSLLQLYTSVDDVKQGYAYDYRIKDSFIAKGYYKNGLPVRGTFIFGHKFSKEKNIVLLVKGRSIKAEVYINGQPESVAMTRQINRRSKKNEIILEFFNELKKKERNFYLDYSM